MAVYSMTGYASGQLHAAAAGPEGGPEGSSALRLGLEIRTVNSRFLDLTLRVADELRLHEAMLRERVGARMKRGKVELRAWVEQDDAGAAHAPSERMLQGLRAAQDTVRSWLPDAAPLSVADLLRLGGTERTPRADWGPPLAQLVESALDDLLAGRAREGARLVDLLRQRIVQLRALARQAAPLVPQLVTQQRQRFLDRWRDALGLAEGGVTPEAAQERALAEATAFALRIDVAEELGRLQAHLDELDGLLGKGGELGKRLDFMIQELHREANTLGSKSATLELTRISVDMKVLIEQMREQVQNIE